MDISPTGNSAVERVLELYSTLLPQPAVRASASLSLLLQALNHSAWPEVSWAFSSLTGDGFPVEFTFSPSNKAINYTTEIIPPEVDCALGPIIAKDILAKVGANTLPENLRQLWQKIQHASVLKYGVWISGRHDVDSDRYKLYIEVPEERSQIAQDYVRTCIGKQLLHNGQPAQLRMIGCDLSSNRKELYFRLKNPESWQIGYIMKSIGMQNKASRLFQFVEQLSNRSFNTSLGSNVGFSVSIAYDNTPVAFSLFGFARSVFRGGDGDIRRALLQCADRLGWNLQTYANVSEPLSMRADWKTHHGMAAFTVTQDGVLAFQIGLRPPNTKINQPSDQT